MRYLPRAIVLTFVLLLVTAWDQAPDRAAAAPGDVLFSLTRAGNINPWFCAGQAGVGVAYSPPSEMILQRPSNDDGFSYSCQDPVTHQTSNLLQSLGYNDPPGLGSPTAITDAQGHNIPIEALAWDSVEERLWAVNRIPVGPVAGGEFRGICAVWRLDEVSKSAELAFTFGAVHGCNYLFSEPNFYDGLTVDPVDNTLYLSAANANFIRHFNKDGTPAANDAINFAALTAGLCGGLSCTSSGLLAGVNGHLISATGTAGKLVEIDPSVPAVVAVYDSGAGRDWGLSCGPVFTLADGSLTNTIASADLLSPNISVLEAPHGICDANDYAARDPLLLPGADFSTGPGQVAYRIFSAEYIGFGSDTVAAGDVLVRMDLSLDWWFFPRRIVAAPGDRCLAPGAPPFNFPYYVPCAEGDTVVPGFDPPDPSIGGQACYDHADNDGDNLTDAADPDCRQTITRVDFSAQATGQYETFYRAVAFLCLWPNTYGVTAGVSVTYQDVVPETDITNNSDATVGHFQCG